jgi:hypothetical protein
MRVGDSPASGGGAAYYAQHLSALPMLADDGGR